MTDMLIELVPDHLREGLRRYVQQHIEPGHFLSSVLANDLMDAVCRADAEFDMEQLRDLLKFIHNEVMPGFCHGSREKVAAWVALGAACRKGETACVHDTWYESQPAATAQ